MTSLGLIDDHFQPQTKADVLSCLDQLNWDTLWHSVCTMDEALAEPVTCMEKAPATASRRNDIELSTLDLKMDLDEAWMLYRMKRWVRDMEDQIRDKFF